MEIKDTVAFGEKFENYLEENCVGQINYEQRVIISRALTSMLDEMEENDA